jgi:hypothetical protein
MSKYLKVLKQIDKRMTAKGYKLVSVGDGEESISSSTHSKTALYDWATQCDMGSMTYITPYDSGRRCTFYLIYGNGLPDTIHDMGYNCELASEDCEQVAQEVSAYFEEKRIAYA